MFWIYKFKYLKNDVLEITYNSFVTYFKLSLGLICMISCFNNNLYIGLICLIAMCTLLTYYLLKYGDLIGKLRDKERSNQLFYSGSKYSLKNPLIIKVKKLKIYGNFKIDTNN